MTEVTKVRIWDLPTRLFHWALVLCVIGLFITGKIGGDAMNWHFRLGYAALTLVAFRIIWGFIGGRWSRFVRFFPTPGRVLRYLNGQSRPEEKAGHNPLGAFSVFALLLLVAAQAVTGLFSYDEIAFAGPLSGVVPDHVMDWATSAYKQWWQHLITVDWATSYHKGLGQYLIIALVSLHVLAIIIYTVRKHHLLWPMVVGDKPLEVAVPPARDTALTRTLALIVLILLAGAVYALVAWGNAQGTAGY